MLLFAILSAASLSFNSITGEEVIEAMKSHLNCSWSQETVDTFKSGDPGDEVTGIAVCFTATYEVLVEAAERGCNLVITHEPSYYNHLDETAMFEGDPVYEKKRELIARHKLMVFRFHDHWHRTRPDGIYTGMMKEFGWEDYLVEGSVNLFDLPPQTAGDIYKKLKQDFPEASMRFIGNPDTPVDRTAFSAGAPGSSAHYALLRMEEVNLLVLGEAREWETVEYVRDAAQAGMPKAAIIMGHAVSEEAGMKYCAEWLRTFISDVPIHFIEAGDPFI